MTVSHGTVRFVQSVIDKTCAKHSLVVKWPREGSGVELLNGAVISSPGAPTDLPLFREAGRVVNVKMEVVESGAGATKLVFRLGSDVLEEHVDLERLETAGAGRMSPSVHLPIMGYRIEAVLKSALSQAGDRRFETIMAVLPSPSGSFLSMKAEPRKMVKKKKPFFG